MAKRTVIHVTYKDGEWKVKKENAQRSSSVHENKKDVVREATEQAKKGTTTTSQVIIHKKDKSIQEEHTYGNDPHPPDG